MPPHAVWSDRHPFSSDALYSGVLGSMAAICYAVSRGTPSGVTWATGWTDSLELSAVAASLGIAHPPGYPLYTGMGFLAIHLFSGLAAARVMALLSALWAGVCIALVAASTRAICRQMGLPPGVGGVSAALVMMVSPALWPAATLANTRTLLAAGAAGIIWAGGRQERRQHGMAGGGAAVMAGLALCAQPTSILALPALLGNRGIRRPTGILILLVGLLLPIGVGWGWLVWRAAQAPALSWGDPRTVSRLWWVISAAPYHHLFGLPSSQALLERATTLLADLGWGGGTLGVVGLAWLARRGQRQRVVIWSGIVTAVIVFTAADHAEAAPQYLVIAAIPLAISAGVGMAQATRQRAPRWLASAVLAMGLLSATVTSNRVLDGMEQASQVPIRYANQALLSLPHSAVLLAPGDALPFALWYAQWGLGRRTDVLVINRSLIEWSWYRQQVNRWLGEHGWHLSAQRGDSGVAADRWLIAMRTLNPRQPLFLATFDPALLRLCVWQRWRNAPVWLCR